MKDGNAVVFSAHRTETTVRVQGRRQDRVQTFHTGYPQNPRKDGNEDELHLGH